MPKQGQRAEVNTFVQGLITEASPLNFPPNASKEEANFELFKDGTRRRRKGIDYETGFVLRNSYSNIYNNGYATSYFEWNSVGGDPSLNFLVISFANTFHIFNTDSNVLSDDGYVGTVFGTTYSGTTHDTWNCASIEGKLVCVGGDRNVVVITYDKTTNTFTSTNDFLKVRDFWGLEVPDPLIENSNQVRPAIDYPEHRYNLTNQSWGLLRKDKVGALKDPIEIYHDEFGIYPSNSELVWTGLQYQVVQAGVDPYERIYPALYEEVFGLAVNASKGFFIIDALLRGTSRVSAFSANYVNSGGRLATSSITAPADRTTKGASCIAEYAGRVFFSGFNGETIGGDARSPDLTNYVLFSQVVKSSSDIFKCYQDGDPTSRDGSDIVDTDGGFLRISGASNIVAMKYIGNSLIVLADNGIWNISGGSDFGFTATNYKVSQISSFGCSSANSVIVQGDSILYWGDGGIYNISADKFGNLGVTNLTQSTIQKLYDSIPESSRTYAYGIYNENTKQARWIYREGVLFTDSSETKELILDFNLSNFTLNTISRSHFNKTELIRPILTSGGVSYLIMGDDFPPDGRKFSFGAYTDTDFLDWKSVDGVGVDAKAFLLTGSQIAGDSAVHKQIPYIVMHFEKTESVTGSDAVPLNQSSCLVNFYWDWAVNENSNKISTLQQAYKYRKSLFSEPNSMYDNGFEVVTSRLKIRGRGRAFALYLETEPKKDCHVLGWNLTLNGDAIG